MDGENYVLFSTGQAFTAKVSHILVESGSDDWQIDTLYETWHVVWDNLGWQTVELTGNWYWFRWGDPPTPTLPGNNGTGDPSIPGFPFEAIILGFLVAIGFLSIVRRNRSVSSH